jgi:hypothetical protein
MKKQRQWSDLFTPTEKQLEALQSIRDHRFVLYGGARGGGKSMLLRWWLLQILLEYHSMGIDNVRVMLACESYPVLTDRQVSKINIEFPKEFGEVKTTKTDGFGFFLREEYGGGAILLRNLDEPDKYMGAEFAAIGIDQIEKTSKETFNILIGSLRWPGIKRPRFVATANPGGQLWVKQLWIDRQFPDEMKPFEQEFSFVQALPKDNSYLDESYWTTLHMLPEMLQKAWIDGDWNIFSGQAFPQWGDRHIIDPFEIPVDWPRWIGIDWGYAAPFAVSWVAKDPITTRVYMYRELRKTRITDRAQAKMIQDYTLPQEHILANFADPSMWSKKNIADVVTSTYDEYLSQGLYLQKGDNNRLSGKRKIDRLLENLSDGKPGLVVFRTCTNWIETFPYLVVNEPGHGDIEDVNTKGDDHLYDALKYALSSVRSDIDLVKMKVQQSVNPMWRMKNI